LNLYQWLRWLHFLSVFAYLLLHGPSLAMAVPPAVTGGQVVRRTRVQGLINEYSRQAV